MQCSLPFAVAGEYTTLEHEIHLTSRSESLSNPRASLAPNLYAIFRKPMHLHFSVWIAPFGNSIGLLGSPSLQTLSTEV